MVDFFDYLPESIYELRLSSCRLGWRDEAIAALARSPVRNLDLSRNSMTESYAVQLFAALQANTNLTALSLAYCDANIGNTLDNLRSLLHANTTLEHLNLSFNSISQTQTYTLIDDFLTSPGRMQSLAISFEHATLSTKHAMEASYRKLTSDDAHRNRIVYFVE
jgi:Leucine Rich repeat